MYILILLLLLVIFIYINNNKNEGFTHLSNDAFVINLDSRPDRMEKVLERFPSLNINRIPAVKATPGSLGCALSHAKTVRKAKEMGLPFVLIMEDDCVPTDAFVHWPKIQTWLENNSEQWDIYLGGNTYYNGTPSDTIKPICNLDSSIKLYNTKALTLHFYYLNSKAYDTFLEWENHKDVPIDLWPDQANMRVVSSFPFIAIQDVDTSDIINSEVDYTNYFTISETAIGIIENIKECFRSIELFKNL